MKTYVFGCFGAGGHRIQDRELRESSMGYLLARTLDDCSRSGSSANGHTWLQRGIFHGVGLVTALHWWDDTGDGRRGGHVAVFAFGSWTGWELLAAAKEHHPEALRVEVHMDRFGCPWSHANKYLIFSAFDVPQGAGCPQESIVNLLLLVLAPMSLRGAKVISETKSEPEAGFVLDRIHPVHADHIWVAQSEVKTAMVPECCWAAEDATTQERLYAAYNLGGSVERAGRTWDSKPVPTWAELQQRAADNDVGAIGVIAKWEAVAQAIDQMGDFHTFGWALRQLKNGYRVRRSGWNGKGMWLCLSGTDGTREIPANGFWAKPNREYAKSQGGSAKVLPCICMKTATGEILMGWLASQTDMLAEDWEYVE